MLRFAKTGLLRLTKRPGLFSTLGRTQFSSQTPFLNCHHSCDAHQLTFWLNNLTRNFFYFSEQCAPIMEYRIAQMQIIPMKQWPEEQKLVVEDALKKLCDYYLDCYKEEKNSLFRDRYAHSVGALDAVRDSLKKPDDIEYTHSPK